MTRRMQLTTGAVAAALALCVSTPSDAVEGGASFYLLGGKLPLSGVVPGPGMYFQNDLYIYSGDAGADIELPIGGEIIANVDAILVFEAPTVLAVTPWEILGGRLGFGATLPVGYADIEAGLRAGSLARGTEDEVFTVGDPVGAALLGWDAGNFHFSVGTTVNVPIGDYQEGEIANIALHRWAADMTGGLTWLDPALGLDLSAAVGFTFNGENEATDYDSGDEFHLEAGITKFFSPAFSAGLGTYYNHQITGDDGPLGDFKGEVFALGGLASYTFEIERRPVTASLKYYHEFDVKNRLQGDAAFLTLAMPLWTPAHAEQAALSK